MYSNAPAFPTFYNLPNHNSRCNSESKSNQRHAGLLHINPCDHCAFCTLKLNLEIATYYSCLVLSRAYCNIEENERCAKYIYLDSLTYERWML